LSAKCKSNSYKNYEKYYVIFNTLKACGKAIFRRIATPLKKVEKVVKDEAAAAAAKAAMPQFAAT